MHISNIFLTNVFLPHRRASRLDIFLFTLPKLYIIIILSPTHFNFVFFYVITEFEQDLYVWNLHPIKPAKDPTFLFICSLASINFTSASST